MGKKSFFAEKNQANKHHFNQFDKVISVTHWRFLKQEGKVIGFVKFEHKNTKENERSRCL